MNKQIDLFQCFYNQLKKNQGNQYFSLTQKNNILNPLPLSINVFELENQANDNYIFYFTLFNKTKNQFEGRTIQQSKRENQSLNIMVFLNQQQKYDFVIEIQKLVSGKNELIGFGVLPCDQTQGKIKIKLYKGESYQLQNQNLEQFEKLQQNLQIEINQNQELKKIFHLIGENMIFCSEDIIPGLINNKISKQCVFQLQQVVNVEIGDILITMPLNFEKDLKQSFFQKNNELNNNSKLVLGDIQIIERQLCIYFHNTWKAVNKYENHNKIILQIVNNQNQNQLQLKGNQSIIVENVFQNSFTFLFFQLNYTLISIGWIPCFIGDQPEIGFKLHDQFIQYPVKTILNQKQINIINQKYLLLDCHINPNNKIQKDIITPQSTLRDKIIDPIEEKQIINTPSVANETVYHPKGFNDISQGNYISNQQMQQSNMNLEQEFMDIIKQKKEIQIQKQQLLNQQLQIQLELKKLQEQKFGQLDNSQLLQSQMTSFKQQYQIDIQTKNQELMDLKRQIEEIKFNSQQVGKQQSLRDYGLQEEFRVVSLKKDMEKELGRQDKISLIKAGVQGLLDKKITEPINIQIDLQSQKNQSIISFKYLGIKYYKKQFPNKIFTTMNFFNIPSFKSDSLSYEQQQPNLFIFIKDNSFSGDNQKQPQYSFTIEDQNQTLTQYLYDKNLQIDIWDSESLMQFGFFHIDLRSLIQQGKDMQSSLKDYNILSFSGQTIGSIQILLTHQSSLTKIKKQHDTQKHIHSLNPISVNIQSSETLSSEEQRIKARIQKLSKNKLDKKQTGWMDVLKSERELRKQEKIKEWCQNQGMTEIDLQVSFGQVYIIPMTIKNSENSEQAFIIQIQDPDAQFQELTVINQKDEWKAQLKLKNFSLPPEWDVISEDNIVLLKPQESITILLKFITLRNISIDQNLENQSSPDFINRRQIKVYCNYMNGKLLQGFNIKINPHHMVIDQIFRFWQKGQSRSTIHLPALYLNDQQQNQIPFLVCSQQQTVLNVNDDCITLQFKTYENQQVQSFNILAYSDKFQSSLLGNFLIEVHCVDHIYQKCSLGQQINQQIQIPNDLRTRKCKLYSSSDSIIFQTPYNNQFTLLPGKFQQINATIMQINKQRSLKEQEEKIQINCVDCQTLELIYSCIIVLETESPQVNRIYELTFKVGHDQVQDLQFENKLKQKVIYEQIFYERFISSQPQTVQILEQFVQFDPFEKKFIKIKISPQNDDINTVYILANDQNEVVFECLLLKLQNSYY